MEELPTPVHEACESILQLLLDPVKRGSYILKSCNS